MQRRRIRTAIPSRDANQNVFHRSLGVLDEHVEIAILIEDARVHQLEFGIQLGAALVYCDELIVRKRGLRILVEKFHVRMRRRGIQVEVILLDVLAVIAFVAGQAEEALLQNRIASIPERQREANVLVTIGDSRDSIFAPAIRARTGVIVRKIFPRGAVRTVVLAHGAPLAFGEIRSPALPVSGAEARFLQPFFFGCHAKRRPAVASLSGCGSMVARFTSQTKCQC